ncbi:1,3-beta-glucanosyltransferase GAS4 [Drechslerella dactyloides]|uniref:1,3-beta-glucanosyltransferase n=1 Tax=Drechslerella dactyloides TaxID=74499 RepID=A0AAD6J2T7_DREDA|nr:1,3-beta-glucanosyltransferase GAS4 [Drechslerella dactyloides]
MHMRSTALFLTAALARLTQAVTPITIKNGGFYGGNNQFFLVGVGYQPGGPVELNQGVDPFSDLTGCQRDVYLLQQLGVNTVRTYAVNTTLAHDGCMSLFAAAGIYVVLDVNAPGWQYSVNRDEPWTSYSALYMSNVFSVMEQFSPYPNVLGFFSGNELANDKKTANLTAPYIRAIQRDMRQYQKAHGLREVPIGYSTADVVDFRQDLGFYLSCTDSDGGYSDFYGINSYEWCGDTTFEKSGYKTLTDLMKPVQMPNFFSEYGCNEVLPRTFGDANAIYSNEMNTVFSGGINYGLVDVDPKTGNAKILPDYETLRQVYSKVSLPTGETARQITRPDCSSVYPKIKSFTPVDAIAQHPDITALIKKGVKVTPGKLVDVDLNLAGHKWTITDTAGKEVTSPVINRVNTWNQVPSAAQAGSSSKSSKNAASGTKIGGGNELAVLAVAGLTTIFMMLGGGLLMAPSVYSRSSTAYSRLPVGDGERTTRPASIQSVDTLAPSVHESGYVYNNDKAGQTHPAHLYQIETASSFRKTADVPDHGLRLPRFIFRGIISILVPLALVFYYWLTYMRWLRYPQDSPESWHRTGYLDSVSIVNYSWFVLATFALNLGTYATAGSVAAMVMRQPWAPRNLRRLIILAGNTFQDPAGWIAALSRIVRKRSLYRSNGLLWDVLAFFSVVGFAAWPLTGLTMQTADGFSISRDYKGQVAYVVGRNLTSINGRDGVLATQRATQFWSAGFSPDMPVRKQFYITPGSKTQVNVTTSNSLPDDASDSIFLAPQIDGPLIGEVFGLAVRYSCNIINSTSQFTILNRRNRTLSLTPTPFGPPGGYSLPDSAVIFLRNKTQNSSPISVISNVNASLELGTDIGLNNITNPADDESIGYVSVLGDYPGLDKLVTLEAALWQNIKSIDAYGNLGVNAGNFVFRDAENDIPELRDEPLYPGQKAVGVRCQASSAIGTAIVNGVAGTYTNFTQRSANPRNGGGIKRFETGIPHLLLQTPYIPTDLRLSSDVDWFSALYSSIEKSSLTNNAFGDFLGAAPSVLQAEDLRNAMLRAHKTWAVHIMYDGITDPSYKWRLGNVTVGKEAMILTRGVVPPEVVLAMLSLWALSVMVFAVLYQFRRRFTETLDGYTLFRFGVDRPEGVVPEMLAGEFDNAATLERLPGMVGDLEPTKAVGYIGLVRGKVQADFKKRYG